MALWRLADSTALGRCSSPIDDPDPEVRWRVLYALEKIVAPDRLHVLIRRSTSPIPNVAQRARTPRAPSAGRSRRARTAYLLADARRRRACRWWSTRMRALQQIGDTHRVHQCAAIAARCSAHPHPYVRVTAATALARAAAPPGRAVGQRRAVRRDADRAAAATCATSIAATRGRARRRALLARMDGVS